MLTLTPWLGAAGAAASSCLASFAILAVLAERAKPHLGQVFPLKSLLRTAVAFTVTVAGGVLLPYDRPVHLLWSVPLALGHVALLTAMGELSIRELASWVRREPHSVSEADGG